LRHGQAATPAAAITELEGVDVNKRLLSLCLDRRRGGSGVGLGHQPTKLTAEVLGDNPAGVEEITRAVHQFAQHVDTKVVAGGGLPDKLCV